jgi:hypothetical protein
MHCPLTIDFAQGYIGVIESKIDVMNIPSTSDISAARFDTQQTKAVTERRAV